MLSRCSRSCAGADFLSLLKWLAFPKRKGYASALRSSAAGRWWADWIDELLGVHDARGISVRKAIEEFGLNPEEISQAELEEETLGYLEFHIEQGPVLERLNLPLGGGRSHRGPKPIRIHILRSRQPCGHNAHAIFDVTPSPGPRSGSEPWNAWRREFRAWWRQSERSKRSPERPT